MRRREINGLGEHHNGKTASSRLVKKLVVRSNFSMFAMAANGEMGGDPRCLFGIRYIVASYSTLQTDSLRCGQNLQDANEIVGGGGKDKKPLPVAARNDGSYANRRRSSSSRTVPRSACASAC